MFSGNVIFDYDFFGMKLQYTINNIKSLFLTNSHTGNEVQLVTKLNIHLICSRK